MLIQGHVFICLCYSRSTSIHRRHFFLASPRFFHGQDFGHFWGQADGLGWSRLKLKSAQERAVMKSLLALFSTQIIRYLHYMGLNFSYTLALFSFVAVGCLAHPGKPSLCDALISLESKGPVQDGGHCSTSTLLHTVLNLMFCNVALPHNFLGGFQVQRRPPEYARS